MTKLTQPQRLILTSARDDEFGLATRPAHLKSAQANRMAAFFADNQLAKEIRAKSDGPVWREDEQGRGIALKILKAGRAALDTVEGVDVKDPVDGSTAAQPEVRAEEGDASTATQITGPKNVLIVSLMQQPGGATIEQLMAATGWLAHTTRAALSGLRKKGVTIARHSAEQGRASVYCIAETRRRAV